VPVDLDRLLEETAGDDTAESEGARQHSEEQVRESLRRAKALLDVRSRAAELFAARGRISWGGLRAVLEAVLPADDERFAAVAAGLRLPPSTLRDLQRGELRATEVEPGRLVFLAEVLELSRDNFLTLVRLDLGDATADDEQALAELEQVWHYAATLEAPPEQ
jgi:hypothetical protein